MGIGCDSMDWSMGDKISVSAYQCVSVSVNGHPRILRFWTHFSGPCRTRSACAEGGDRTLMVVETMGF